MRPGCFTDTSFLFSFGFGHLFDYENDEALFYSLVRFLI